MSNQCPYLTYMQLLSRCKYGGWCDHYRSYLSCPVWKAHRYDSLKKEDEPDA